MSFLFMIRHLRALFLLLSLLIFKDASSQKWERLITDGGSSGNEIFSDMHVDGDGNVYLTGSFSGSATFGNTLLTSNGGTDFFVVKYDSSGNLIYASSGGSASSDLSNAIVSDNNGNAYITGQYSAFLTIAGTTLVLNGSTDIFTIKVDNQGNFVWAKKAGGIFDFNGSTYRDRGLDIAFDNNNGIYVAGVTSGQQMVFGPFLHGLSQSDATDFVGKYDLNGVEQWIESGSNVGVAGSQLSISTSLAYDPVSNSIIVGGYNKIVVSVGGGGFTNNSDLYLRQIQLNGTLGWFRQFGGSAQEELFDIDLDVAGNIYVTGLYNGDLAIPSGNIVATAVNDGQGSEISDAFILKLNSNASSLNYVKSVSGSQDVDGLGISASPSGVVYVSGRFKGSPGVDNVALNPKGEFDIFLLRIDSLGNLSWVEEAGGSGDDVGVNVFAKSSESIVLSGGFSAISMFGNFTRASLGFSDAFLANLNCKPGLPVLINSPDTVLCINDSSEISIANKFGAHYLFSLSSGGSIDTTGNTTKIFWTSPGNHQLQIIPTNVCGQGEIKTINFLINDVPGNTIISGDTNICLGLGTYTAQNLTANSFSWSLNGGGSLVPLNNQALVSWFSPGSYVLQVSGQNECGTGPDDSIQVSVAQFPSGPIVINGSNSSCFQTDTFTINSQIETSYTWDLSSGGILQAFDTFAVVNWTQSGSHILQVTPNNVCGTGGASSKIINVTASPSNLAITGDSVACIGSSSFSLPNQNGVTYNWAVSGGGNLLNLGNTAIVNWNNAGNYFITASAQNTCGVSNVDTFYVSVKSSAVQPGPVSGNPIVCLGSESYSVAQQDGQTYVWSLSSGGNLSFVNNQASVNWTQTGFHTLSVTTSNNCGQGQTRDLIVEVRDVPAQPGVIFGNDEVCLGLENYNVFAQSGINYNWSLSGGGQVFPSGNSASVNWTLPGTYDLIVTPSNSCGSGIPRILSVEAKDVPLAISGISGIDTVCLGSQIYTIDSPEIGNDINYNWSLSGGGLIAPNGNNATINWTTPGTYTLTVQAQNACGFGQPLSKFITVRNTVEQISSISGDDLVCLDTNIYSVPVVGGFTYNWSLTGGGALSASGNQAEVIWQNTGNYNLSVTTSDGCTKSLPIEVKDIPQQPSAIGGDTVVCFGTKSYAIQPVSGQTFNWSLSGGGTVSAFGNAAIASWNTTGQYDVQVSATNLCGTGPQQTLAVNVLTIPQAPVLNSGDSLLCQNESEMYGLATIPFESYSWSLNRGGLITPANSSASVQWLDTGNAILSVNATNLCGTGPNTTLAIRINDVPGIPQITGPDKVCLDSQLYLTGLSNDLNYNWSLLSGGILNDSLNVAGVFWQDTGTHILELFLDNNCGNSDTQSFAVEVFDIPFAPEFVQGDSIACLGLSSYRVTQKPEESYIWSLSGGGILNALGNSATINWTSTGVHQIFVRAGNLCGQGPVDTFEIEVRAVPQQPASINGAISVCLDNRLYSVVPQNNVTYNWSLSGNGLLSSGDSNTASVNWTNTGLAALSVTATNLCGTSPSQSVSINISDIPGLPVFTGGDTLSCLGNEIYSLAPSSGLSYNWTLPAGGTINPNGNQANITWNQTGNWQIISSLTNFCGTGPEDTLFVRVKTIPVALQFINPDTIVCLGNTVYEVTSLPETNYSWSLNGGGTFSFVNNRAFVTWTNPGAFLLSVTPNNICGSGSTSTLQVDVNSVPDPPVFSNPDTLSCLGPETFIVNPQTGADYLWSLSGGGGASSNGNQYNVNWTSTGNYQINVSAFNFCGTSSTNSIGVEVNEIPERPGLSSGDSIVCTGNQTYVVQRIPELIYNWNLSGGGILNASADSAIVNWLVPGNHNLRVNAENYCGTGADLRIDVEVNDIPSAPTGLNGASTVCNGDLEIYSVNPVSGFSYAWRNSGNPLASDSSSILVNWSVKGPQTLDVRAVNFCGTGPSSQLEVNVRDVPEFQGSLLGSDKICRGNLANYEVSNLNGVTYSWSIDGDNEINAQNNQSTVDWRFPGQFTIGVVAENLCGKSVPLEKLVTVDDDPVKPQIIVNGDSIVSSSDIDNVWYLNGELIEDSGVNFLIPDQTGRYTLQVINSCGESELSEFVSYYAGDNLSDEIYLIPNPAIENVRIQLPLNVLIEEIEIIDSQGKLQGIFNSPSSNKLEFNVNFLNPGLYLLKIQTSLGENVVKKLVVN